VTDLGLTVGSDVIQIQIVTTGDRIPQFRADVTACVTGSAGLFEFALHPQRPHYLPNMPRTKDLLTKRPYRRQAWHRGQLTMDQINKHQRRLTRHNAIAHRIRELPEDPISRSQYVVNFSEFSGIDRIREHLIGHLFLTLHYRYRDLHPDPEVRKQHRDMDPMSVKVVEFVKEHGYRIGEIFGIQMDLDVTNLAAVDLRGFAKVFKEIGLYPGEACINILTWRDYVHSLIVMFQSRNDHVVPRDVVVLGYTSDSESE
jgi:hypothetical protein